MQHSPCLSMKLTLVQDARMAHMCTKSIGSKMNIALSISKLHYPKSIPSRCTTTLN